jgi:tetratricopeptide (TPR) repeat protein
MRKIFWLIACLCIAAFLKAQSPAQVDSFKANYSRAKTDAEKIKWLDNLSRVLMNVNQAEAEKYGKEMIEIAEMSRDRKLIIKAFMSNGTRCSYFAGRKDFADRAIGYFNQALTVARENKFDEETGEALLSLSNIYLKIPDADKSLNYTTEAFSLISVSDNNDSLMAECHKSFGKVYLVKDQKLLSLRNYLTALRIAEGTQELLPGVDNILCCHRGI